MVTVKILGNYHLASSCSRKPRCDVVRRAAYQHSPRAIRRIKVMVASAKSTPYRMSQTRAGSRRAFSIASARAEKAPEEYRAHITQEGAPGSNRRGRAHLPRTAEDRRARPNRAPRRCRVPPRGEHLPPGRPHSQPFRGVAEGNALLEQPGSAPMKRDTERPSLQRHRRLRQVSEQQLPHVIEPDGKREDVKRTGHPPPSWT